MTQVNSELAVRPAGAVVASVSFDQLMAMAESVANSGLFGCKSTDQAATLMMLAQAEGVHPIQAMRMYHIIEGRPSMRADAMQAKFQIHGGRVTWLERTDDVVSAEFSHAELQPNPIVVTWDNERVAAAGLNRGNHNKYPLQMKAARVISEGVGAVMPEVKMGLYTPEEVNDFGQDGKPHNATRKLATQPDVVEGTVVENPDTELLRQWDTASAKHGIDGPLGREVLRKMCKTRFKAADLAKADAAARAEMLAEYQATPAEKIEQLKVAVAKKQAAAAEKSSAAGVNAAAGDGNPVEPTPADEQPVDQIATEPPVSAETVKGWEPFLEVAIDSATRRGVDAAVALKGIEIGVLSIQRKGKEETITADWKMKTLTAIRLGTFDYATGKMLSPPASNAAA